MNRALSLVGDCFLDHSESVSCQRIVTFAVTITVLGMWVWGCLHAGQFLPLGWPEVSLLAGSQGAKALQSRFELGAGGLRDYPLSGEKP